MKNRNHLVALTALFLTGSLPAVPVPLLINYQGRVIVGTTNFDGTGQFKFALVDGGVNTNVQATATAMAGGRVLFISVANGGSGYISAPAVMITDATGSGATAVATVTGGVVTSIQITNGGSGYSFTPTVTIAAPPPNIVTSIYWKNDGSPGPLGNEPATAVSLPVTKGLYSVLLGDATIANMAAIPTFAFTFPDVRLRVWFSDGTATGFQLLTPDQRLAPAAYLGDGVVTTASLANGAVTTAKISNQAITGGQIANNTIDAGRLATPSAPAIGQVLSYNAGGLNWTAPNSWLLGGNGGTPSTSFLGTTDTQNLIFKTNNIERLRLTTGGDVLLQKPDSLPAFSTRNGLGVYGRSSAFDDVGQLFAGANILGPVLYGQAGGGLGVKSSTNVETLVLRWDSAGNVGIGTGTGPLVSKLGIAGQNALTMTGGQPYLTFSDTNAAGAQSRIAGVAGALVFQPESYISGASTNHFARLADDGTFSVRILTIRGGADLAEPFQMKEEELEKGSVVVIDDEHPGRLKRSTRAYDTRVAGIVSGANGINPGIALHQEGVIEGGQNVALSGRVYVRADASSGPIKPGDLLTTSDLPGHAMKVTEHARAQGAVIGKAMSTLDNGTGMVLVLVTLQ